MAAFFTVCILKIYYMKVSSDRLIFEPTLFDFRSCLPNSCLTCINLFISFGNPAIQLRKEKKCDQICNNFM